MIVTIHQPNYLPWLGYFHKMSLCQTLVLLDSVPYSKNSYQNRCKLKARTGEVWLTLPVRTAGRFSQLTNQAEIDGSGNCILKHWRTIEQHYRRAPHFDFVETMLRPVYETEWVLLADMCTELIRRLAAALRLSATLVRASELPVTGSRSELLVSICAALKASEYLSGPSGRNYLEEQVFSSAGIRVSYHSFKSPVYPQLHGDFAPGLSVLDLLANCGPLSAEYLLIGPQAAAAQ